MMLPGEDSKEKEVGIRIASHAPLGCKRALRWRGWQKKRMKNILQ